MIPLDDFIYVSPQRVRMIRDEFKKDYIFGNRHLILHGSKYTIGLYRDVIKHHIPWVNAKKLSNRKIEVWISKPV